MKKTGTHKRAEKTRAPRTNVAALHGKKEAHLAGANLSPQRILEGATTKTDLLDAILAQTAAARELRYYAADQ